MNEPAEEDHACPGGTAGPDRWTTWRAAAQEALYGPGRPQAADGVRDERPGGAGFFVRERPGAHFRTSVHASPLFAQAVARLLLHVDEALGRPGELALVDVGAGRGELLTGVLGVLPADCAARVRPYAVELAPRPEGLDERVVWTDRLPAESGLVGLLFANEWLDNVPLDVVETGPDGLPHTVLVRPDGAERLGEPPAGGPDAEWLERWWPLGPRQTSREGKAGTDGMEPELTAGRGGRYGRGADSAAGGAGAADAADAIGVGDPADGAAAPPGASTGSHPEAGPHPEAGTRAEVGRPRDEAWSAAVRTLDRGLAVTADYAHFRAARPPFGTLTGYLDGRQVAPVPDGSRDLTAHVALDACAAAGEAAAAERSGGSGPAAVLLSQREALHALGVRGTRPPLALASSDPAAYVRQLAAAGEAAELTDPGGLGGHWWLIQPLGGVPSPFS